MPKTKATTSKETEETNKKQKQDEEAMREMKDSILKFNNIGQMILSETRDTKVCTQTLEKNINILKDKVITLDNEFQTISKEMKEIRHSTPSTPSFDEHQEIHFNLTKEDKVCKTKPKVNNKVS
jgi:hypothetical protein